MKPTGKANPPPQPAARIQPPPATVGLSEEINSYLSLPDNWDGYNGHAPAQKDAENAKAFLSAIKDENVMSGNAETMVAGDGDVGFIWRGNGGDYLEVGFIDGSISYFGVAGAEEITGEEQYNASRIPANLLDFMRRTGE